MRASHTAPPASAPVQHAVAGLSEHEREWILLWLAPAEGMDLPARTLRDALTALRETVAGGWPAPVLALAPAKGGQLP
jgi:hypothetical protein